MNNLLLCAGGQTEDGFTTHDGGTYHGVSPDIQGIIPPLPDEIMRQRWDQIMWRHGITSLYPWDAIDVLTQLYSVLLPNGTLTLEQPNVTVAFRAALDSLSNITWVYGDPSLLEPLHMVKWGYTPDTLINACQQAGFTRFTHVEPSRWPERDFALEARP